MSGSFHSNFVSTMLPQIRQQTHSPPAHRGKATGGDRPGVEAHGAISQPQRIPGKSAWHPPAGAHPHLSVGETPGPDLA
jgi:hypothetical protein